MCLNMSELLSKYPTLSGLGYAVFKQSPPPPRPAPPRPAPWLRLCLKKCLISVGAGVLSVEILNFDIDIFGQLQLFQSIKKSDFLLL